MTEGFQQIVPSIPPAADILGSHHLAHEFRREVEYRDNFQQYCQWYRLTALKHQQELAKMKKDINIFGWFLR